MMVVFFLWMAQIVWIHPNSTIALVVQHDCVRERMAGLVVHELRCVVANTDKCMMEEGGMALLLGKLKLGNKSI